MTNSIEARFDMENTTVLKGLGFLHPCRISHSEAWENIATAAKWFQNDLDLQALESEIFSLQRSSLVTDVIEEAVREKRKPDFLDLFKALQAEPECYSWVTKLMNCFNTSNHFLQCRKGVFEVEAGQIATAIHYKSKQTCKPYSHVGGSRFAGKS